MSEGAVHDGPELLYVHAACLPHFHQCLQWVVSRPSAFRVRFPGRNVRLGWKADTGEMVLTDHHPHDAFAASTAGKPRAKFADRSAARPESPAYWTTTPWLLSTFGSLARLCK